MIFMNKKKILIDLIYILIGSAILAFGLYHVHSQSNVTEGGALGATLLLQHWFHISPAVSGFIINFTCYALGLKVLGKEFIVYSAISGGAFSVFYAFFEQFDPIWPQIGEYPLVAAIVGALFVGVGVGLCVRVGGAPSGDDALAMSLSKIVKIDIQWMYLITDLSILALSLSYIPLQKIIYSLLTVVLSGQLIGWIVKFSWKKA